MTLDDYFYVIKRIDKKENFAVGNPKHGIQSIFLIGGEPLCHSDIDGLLWNINFDFPDAEIIIQTNGKLLPFFYHCTEPKIKWLLSEYPDWNDQIVDDYKDAPNVQVYRFGGMFWDISTDPCLSDADAKKARAECLFVCRVIGRNLYDCCLSEGIEREMGLLQTGDLVHVPFTENWREDIYKIETWKACRFCFRARMILESGTMYGKRTRSHDE